MKGKKLAAFETIIEAGKQLHISPGTISRAAKKKPKHAGGFVWRYEGETYEGEYKNLLKKRKFAQHNLNGQKIRIFKSISDAAKYTNGSYEGIRLTLQGKTKSSGGFFWKWM